MLAALYSWVANSWIGRVMAAVSAGLVAAAVFYGIAFKAGKDRQKAAEDAESLKNLRNRSKVDDETSKLTDAELRERLGKWVSNDGR